MPRHDPNIFQCLTGAGTAAIALIRIRGDLCRTFIRMHSKRSGAAETIEWRPGRVYRAELLDSDGQSIDDILISVHNNIPVMDLRLHLHGGSGIVACCRDLLRNHGFTEIASSERYAQPDLNTNSTVITDISPVKFFEFLGSAGTLEYHLTEQETGLLDAACWIGKNLIETEAYVILPKMLTLRGVTWLLSQPTLWNTEIDTLAGMSDRSAARERCRMILSRPSLLPRFSKPLRIALVGPPNVGKSTLMNAVADREVSLVSAIPGTTRDWLEQPGEIAGFPVSWLDTAGLWDASNPIDLLATASTRRLLGGVDVILLVADPDHVNQIQTLSKVIREITSCPMGFVLNKTDTVVPQAQFEHLLPSEFAARTTTVSARERTGLDALERNILTISNLNAIALDQVSIFTTRQRQVLDTLLSANDPDFPRLLRRL